MTAIKKACLMIKEFFPVLAETNPHKRDLHITLDHDAHIYTIKGYPEGFFKSVTTWKSERFPEFVADEVIERMQTRSDFGEGKYSGMTATEIKNMWENKKNECADLGKWLHRDIEGFLNDNSLTTGYSNGDLFRNHKITFYEETVEETQEWYYFMLFTRDYENYRIVGTIDCVFKFTTSDGQIKYAIFDWKRSEKKVQRCKHYDGQLPDVSLRFMRNNDYWKYAIQLNLYRIILMDKYDISTDHMYILRLHPNSSSYQLIRMPILDWVLRPLLQARN
jgi:hypothetical protein